MLAYDRSRDHALHWGAVVPRWWCGGLLRAIVIMTCLLEAHACCVRLAVAYFMITQYNSWTPLIWAASGGHTECIQLLLEYVPKVM